MVTQLNVVLVEDHDNLREVTADVLRQQGYHVLAFSCAEDIDEQLGARPVDIFILDLNLPGEDGLSLARRLRKVHPGVGILMVTARNKPQDMTLGFHEGADVYLVKPLSTETILAAVEALRRRLQKNERKDEIHLNPANLTLSCGSESVVLLPAEVDILIAFARAPEHRLETWQLIELLNGEDANASKSSIEIRLTRLHKKMLACGANPHCITAIRGVGYQLCHVPVIF